MYYYWVQESKETYFLYAESPGVKVMQVVMAVNVAHLHSKLLSKIIRFQISLRISKHED